MSERIDDIDVQILTLLQRDGRMKRNRIAEEVGLSVPSVSERMKKLMDREVISGYHAVLNAKRLHKDITAFIQVRVNGSKNYPGFIKKAGADPEILEIHSCTGAGSHIIKIRTTNTTSLEKLLGRIQQWPGVEGTVTNVVLSSFKESRELAVEPMDRLAPMPE